MGAINLCIVSVFLDSQSKVTNQNQEECVYDCIHEARNDRSTIRTELLPAAHPFIQVKFVDVGLETTEPLQ